MDGKICNCRDIAREAQVRGDLAWHKKLLQHRDNRIAALEADLREARAALVESASTAQAACGRLMAADDLLRAVARDLDAAPGSPAVRSARERVVAFFTARRG